MTFTPQSVLDVADLGAGLHHPERGGDALLRPPLPLQSAGVDLHRVATGEVFVTSDTVTYILLPDTIVFGCESSPISRNVPSSVSQSVRQMQNKAK